MIDRRHKSFETAFYWFSQYSFYSSSNKVPTLLIFVSKYFMLVWFQFSVFFSLTSVRYKEKYVEGNYLLDSNLDFFLCVRTTSLCVEKLTFIFKPIRTKNIFSSDLLKIITKLKHCRFQINLTKAEYFATDCIWSFNKSYI